jgi:hypothetical protein
LPRFVAPCSPSKDGKAYLGIRTSEKFPQAKFREFLFLAVRRRTVGSLARALKVKPGNLERTSGQMGQETRNETSETDGGLISDGQRSLQQAE